MPAGMTSTWRLRWSWPTGLRRTVNSFRDWFDSPSSPPRDQPAGPNIVAGEVTLSGRRRKFDRALRSRLLERIAQLADGMATSMRGRSEFRLDSEAPPVINDPATAGIVAEAAGSLLGAQAVVP